MIQYFQAYFNSIKVQLEPYVSEGKVVGIQFQFHKGTIRTENENRNGKAAFISIP